MGWGATNKGEYGMHIFLDWFTFPWCCRGVRQTIFQHISQLPGMFDQQSQQPKCGCDIPIHVTQVIHILDININNIYLTFNLTNTAIKGGTLVEN